jgi:eukaryotic-like serine/threonine-protein kinase
VVDHGRKAPAVKELVWPPGHELSKWEVLPETNQLKVYTDATSLLQLGETDADSWVFAATFRQLANAGRIGLFLGHRKDPRTATATFELIHLDIAGVNAYLKRSVQTYQFDVPFLGAEGRTYRSVPVDGLRPENTLRVTVRANKIAEVRLNDKDYPDLVEVALKPPAAGAFGVFNRNSDGVFSRLLFNDNPIPLLTDASGRVPEKP